jgi:hypothetical protein
MLLCEGLFFIFGLIALIGGKFRLFGKRTALGTRARIVGLILILPGPVALFLGFMLGLSGGATEDAVGILTVFEALMLVAAFVAAIVITLTSPEAEAQLTPGSVPLSGNDANTQRLRQLREMVDSGLISEDEYQKKKSEILNRM